jgi:acetyltransferase-like isoleucine patch superfamily enzyme
MDMELAKRAVISLPKIIAYKIKFGGRFHAPMIHALGRHSYMVIKKNAAVTVGRELVTRDNFQLRAESGEISIGDKCFFNVNCSVTCMEKISIGEGCQIGNNVVIVDHNHTKDFSGYTTAPVTIGAKVWIGANCVILPGSVIGDGAVIGAGSIVNGEIPSNTTYYNRREKVMVEK